MANQAIAALKYLTEDTSKFVAIANDPQEYQGFGAGYFYGEGDELITAVKGFKTVDGCLRALAKKVRKEMENA